MGGQSTGGDGTITRLLASAHGGDRTSVDRVIQLLYDELRKQARRELGPTRRPDGINGTSLVHAACARILKRESLEARDREQFMRLFARAMRDEFVEYVRRKGAAKRGGKHRRVPMVDFEAEGERLSLDVLEVKNALEELQECDPDSAEVLVFVLFGGRTLRETAAVLGRTFSEVRRNWEYGRTWLLERLSGPDSGTKSER